MSDPPSGTNADGVGVGVKSTRQPTPAPPDPVAEDDAAGWTGRTTQVPPSALVPRLLADLYEAVRDLGSAGAAKNARAALVELQRDAEELIRVGTLAESAVGHAAISRSDAHGPSR